MYRYSCNRGGANVKIVFYDLMSWGLSFLGLSCRRGYKKGGMKTR